MGACKQIEKQNISEQEQAYSEMLEKALSLPGVREYMRVYNNWREIDQELDTFRSIRQLPLQRNTSSSTTPK